MNYIQGVDQKKDILYSIKKHRQIRVFVSSTFKDMQREREELIKYIFPKLRKLCEERGVRWSEVDLRWGVTSEQNADGKVLPICMTEIENCFPFFIGILGDRYGWVPNVDEQMVKREPWLLDYQGRSVTELEILKGALMKGKEDVNAFFYFRDSNSYVYHDEDPQEETDKQKLRELKGRIKKSGFPLYENYHDYKQLGELVFQDFKRAIDLYFPLNELEDEVEKNKYDQEIFAMNRAKYFVGREDYLKELDAYIQNGGAPMVLSGQSGSGKSAILSHWATEYKKQEVQKMPLVMHFVGSGREMVDTVTLMKKIILELSRTFDIKVPLSNNLNELIESFTTSLELAAKKNDVILLIDALDQLGELSEVNSLFWFPNRIPFNMRLILSTTNN